MIHELVPAGPADQQAGGGWAGWRRVGERLGAWRANDVVFSMCSKCAVQHAAEVALNLSMAPDPHCDGNFHPFV